MKSRDSIFKSFLAEILGTHFLDLRPSHMLLLMKDSEKLWGKSRDGEAMFGYWMKFMQHTASGSSRNPTTLSVVLSVHFRCFRWFSVCHNLEFSQDWYLAH